MPKSLTESVEGVANVASVPVTADTVHVTKLIINSPPAAVPSIWAKWEVGALVEGEWRCINAYEALIEGQPVIDAMLTVTTGASLRDEIKAHIYALLANEPNMPAGTVV